MNAAVQRGLEAGEAWLDHLRSCAVPDCQIMRRGISVYGEELTSLRASLQGGGCDHERQLWDAYQDAVGEVMRRTFPNWP